MEFLSSAAARLPWCVRVCVGVPWRPTGRPAPSAVRTEYHLCPGRFYFLLNRAGGGDHDVAKFAEKVRAKVGNKPILVHVVVGSSDTGSLKFTLAPYPEAAFPIGDLVNAVQTTLAAYPKVTAGTPNVSTVGKVHTVELADGSAFRATFGA